MLTGHVGGGKDHAKDLLPLSVLGPLGDHSDIGTKSGAWRQRKQPTGCRNPAMHRTSRLVQKSLKENLDKASCGGTLLRLAEVGPVASSLKVDEDFLSIRLHISAGRGG